MNIFLSYPSEERALADEIQLALAGAGHTVFFDRDSLPAGDDYHQRIQKGIAGAELFVFLITPDSVAAGSYALTEMALARARWPSPAGHVLPVLARPTPMVDIPPYLKAVTLLEPAGNLVAEVLAAATRLQSPSPSPSSSLSPSPAPAPGPPPPSAPGGGLPRLALGGAAALLAVAAAVFFWPKTPRDPELARLDILVEQAKVACAADSSAEDSAKVNTQLALLVDQVKGEGGISAYRNKHNGAAAALPAELQVSENAKIRSCMDPYMRAIFKLIGIEVPAAASSLPRQIELRFNYIAPDAADPTFDDKLLRLSLQMNGCTKNEFRLAQQPDGSYIYPICYYPPPDELVRGALVRDVRLSTVQAHPAPALFCLRRPAALPNDRDDFVHLECPEGKECGLHFPSPKWLEPVACPKDSPQTASAFGLIATAYADVAQRRWTVPSVATLDANKGQRQGVGYTLFSFETDAFRGSAVTSVEVDMRVNGTPILEDGLLPAQRPVANDPKLPFKHAFALEQLDFEGALGGCDAVQLTLRPRLAGGRAAGAPLHAQLTYVALRDHAEATVPLGPSQLRWSARYMVPPGEWRNEAFITSVPYAAAGGDAAAARAREHAVALKQAFDRLGLRDQGRPLVAVVRPPLTLNAGTLAYGLALGTLLPSGQVRFTFPFAEADRLGGVLLAARQAHPAARGVIAAQKYVYEAAGNSTRRETPTPPGVCSHLKAG